MDEVIAEIKGLQRSMKSLRDSVDLTCRVLKRKEDKLRSQNGICSVDGCYESAVRLRDILSDEWLCDHHYKKEKGIIV